MTLTQLSERLNTIIQENISNGWAERNNLQMMVELRRKTPTGKLRSKFVPVAHASSSVFGLGTTDVMTISANEE